MNLPYCKFVISRYSAARNNALLLLKDILKNLNFFVLMVTHQNVIEVAAGDFQLFDFLLISPQLNIQTSLCRLQPIQQYTLK